MSPTQAGRLRAQRKAAGGHSRPASGWAQTRPPKPRPPPARLAGEAGLAGAPRPGPGSLRVGLLDALHLMGRDEVVAGARVRAVDAGDGGSGEGRAE